MWIDFSVRSETHSLKVLVAKYGCKWRVWDVGDDLSNGKKARTFGAVAHIAGGGDLKEHLGEIDAFVKDHADALSELNSLGVLPVVEIAFPVGPWQSGGVRFPPPILALLGRHGVCLDARGYPCAEEPVELRG